MSIYTPIRDYLSKLDVNVVELSFAEIEKIIRRKLPDSASKYNLWWANDRSHTQAENGWLAAGWEAHGTNLNLKTVRFSRVRGPVSVSTNLSPHLHPDGNEIVLTDIRVNQKTGKKKAGFVLLSSEHDLELTLEVFLQPDTDVFNEDNPVSEHYRAFRELHHLLGAFQLKCMECSTPDNEKAAP